jgi:outer membrane receptor protein involved in Fe transport
MMNGLLKLFFEFMLSFFCQLFSTLLLCLLCVMPVYGASEDDMLGGLEDDIAEEAAIDFLMDVGLEELGELEVTLDDVFDVFDGLIKKRKTKMATGAKQSTERAPSVTTVITAQDIEAIGATDLDEVLETVPGLHVSRDTILYNPIYAIRGIHSSTNPEVLVLINGISIKNLFFGNRGRAWGVMPVNAISRIEIVRGPGSAMFGADAFSGVINIITKSMEEINGTEIGMRAGTFDTQNAWLLHGSQQGGFDIAAMLEYHNTDGHQEIIDVDSQSHFDKVHGTNVSFAPGSVSLSQRNLDTRLDISRGHWQLRTGYQGRRNVGNGVGVTQVLDPRGRYEADHTNADLIYHNPTFTQYWDVTTQVNYYHTTFTAYNQTAYPPGFNHAYPEGRLILPNVDESHTRFAISGFYAGFAKHLVRIGAGYDYGDLYNFTQRMNFGRDPATGKPLPPSNTRIVELTDTPYAAMIETDRKNEYVFLQDTWTLNTDWELTTGVRYDHYSDFGTTVNPRLALVWQPHPNYTSKLLYGRAFRAPSFSELYTKGPITKSNPNLKPEIIQTWELAFDYRATEHLNLALNLFTYKIDDVIRSQVESQPGFVVKSFTVHNGDSQVGRGLEMEARWKLTKNFSVLGNYAFQKSIDKRHDHDVGKAPQHQIYLRTDWMPIPNWYIDTQINWVADRARSYGDPRPELDDYATLDLTLRYKNIKEPWNLALSVHNLFDTTAYEPSPGPNSSGFISIPNDLPQAGRQWLLEVRYRF